MNKNERFLSSEKFFRCRLYPFRKRFEGLCGRFVSAFDTGFVVNF